MNHTSRLAWLACLTGIAVVLACLGQRASAQTGDSGTVVRGMFGPRVLGEPLRPRPSPSGTGIIRGPSGEFYGIGRPEGTLFRGNRLPSGDRLNQTVPVPPAWLRDSAVPAGVADAYRRPPDPIPVQDITAGPSVLPALPGDLPLRDSVEEFEVLREPLTPEPVEPLPAPKTETSRPDPKPKQPARQPNAKMQGEPGQKEPLQPGQPGQPGQAEQPGQPGPGAGDDWLRSPYTTGQRRPAGVQSPEAEGDVAAADATASADRGVIITSRSMARSARVVSSRGAAADSAGAAVESTLRNARPARPNLIRATVEGGTMVLRGRVASEHDRGVAEAAARMEPGVESVRNELRVETPAADAK